LTTAVKHTKKKTIILAGMYKLLTTKTHPKITNISEFSDISNFEKKGILFSLKGGIEYKK
jgi:hypothetical protein